MKFVEVAFIFAVFCYCCNEATLQSANGTLDSPEIGPTYKVEKNSPESFTLNAGVLVMKSEHTVSGSVETTTKREFVNSENVTNEYLFTGSIGIDGVKEDGTTQNIVELQTNASKDEGSKKVLELVNYKIRGNGTYFLKDKNESVEIREDRNFTRPENSVSHILVEPAIIIAIDSKPISLSPSNETRFLNNGSEAKLRVPSSFYYQLHESPVESQSRRKRSYYYEDSGYTCPFPYCEGRNGGYKGDISVEDCEGYEKQISIEYEGSYRDRCKNYPPGIPGDDEGADEDCKYSSEIDWCGSIEGKGKGSNICEKIRERMIEIKGKGNKRVTACIDYIYEQCKKKLKPRGKCPDSGDDGLEQEREIERCRIPKNPCPDSGDDSVEPEKEIERCHNPENPCPDSRDSLEYEKESESCRIPKSRKYSYLNCTSYPSKVMCDEQCVFGYTFKRNNRRKQKCYKSTGEWTPSKDFSECKPFIDCTIRLKPGGSKKCISNYLDKGARCYISCSGGQKVSKKMYRCNIQGKWSPKLPWCAKAGTGQYLVPPPKKYLLPEPSPQPNPRPPNCRPPFPSIPPIDSRPGPPWCRQPYLSDLLPRPSRCRPPFPSIPPNISRRVPPQCRPPSLPRPPIITPPRPPRCRPPFPSRPPRCRQIPRVRPQEMRANNKIRKCWIENYGREMCDYFLLGRPRYGK